MKGAVGCLPLPRVWLQVGAGLESTAPELRACLRAAGRAGDHPCGGCLARLPVSTCFSPCHGAGESTLGPLLSVPKALCGTFPSAAITRTPMCKGAPDSAHDGGKDSQGFTKKGEVEGEPSQNPHAHSILACTTLCVQPLLPHPGARASLVPASVPVWSPPPSPSSFQSPDPTSPPPPSPPSPWVPGLT